MFEKTKFQIISLMALITLSLSTIIPALAYAEPLATSAKDWQFTNANSWAWNYSPETQITKDNVDQLETKWIFPIAGATSAHEGVKAATLSEGSTTPPLVVDGKVFITTNYLRTYAIDAKTGKQLWAHDYKINPSELMEKIPILLGPSAGVLAMLNAHLHGIRYWEEGNMLLINGMACDFYGINADTGETSLWIQDLCVNVPGNLYAYRQGTSNTDGVSTYEKGRQFIFVLPGAMHSYVFTGDARHVIMGIDMDTHQVLWRVFNFPPQDVPTKDWALQECDIGYFRDIPCSEVAAQAPENLEWDWAEENETPSPYGGVTANWGAQPIIDEDTGILYTQTGNQGPYTYIGATPGPRLYGSTIMAIDMAKGERIWWVQPFQRDPYDYDCDWDGILADVSGLGKVYMKGCKEGLLHVLDAATGEPHYIIDIAEEQLEWGQISDLSVKYHLNDPFSYYDMREMKSPDGSIYCGRPCNVYPYWSNGILATDMSYDPETGTLFHYAAALQTQIIESIPPETAGDGGSMSITVGYPIMNTTIVARDVATGDVKWRWFWPIQQQRSHMIITPDMVLSGFKDGYLRFFDKETGTLLREMNLGAFMGVGITTGQDSDGNQKLFTILGSGQVSRISPVTPGSVVAVGLSERIGDGDKVTTITTTVTSATTSTIVSTAAISTTTVTSEVTEEVGLPAEITYAAVAVAVIAIIAAAVLMMRKK